MLPQELPAHSRAYVDANYRYIAAYQEINARITQRQQALALYVTLVVSLLASMLALRPSEGSAWLPVEWLILGFPVSAMCLAFLNHKAERAITNLRQFLSALEKLQGAHEVLPSYNTHSRWSQDANKARRFHDYAAAVLVVGGSTIGLASALALFPVRFAAMPYTWWGSVLVAGVSAAVIFMGGRWHFKPVVF